MMGPIWSGKPMKAQPKKDVKICVNCRRVFEYCKDDVCPNCGKNYKKPYNPKGGQDEINDLG